MGLFACAFVGPKGKGEEAAEPPTFGADEGAVVGCVVLVKNVDETGRVAGGIDAEVCATGFGAEGKGNKLMGAAAVVLT